LAIIPLLPSLVNNEERGNEDIGLVWQPVLLNPIGFGLPNKSHKMFHILLILLGSIVHLTLEKFQIHFVIRNGG
jgi:hypothetical protein